MPEMHELTNDELMLRELHSSIVGFKEQRDKSRLNKINAEIAERNLNTLISDTLVEISELERKGIKHYPETPTEPAKNAEDKDKK